MAVLNHGFDVVDLEEDESGGLYIPAEENGVEFVELVDSGSARTVVHPIIVEQYVGYRTRVIKAVPGDEPVWLADGLQLSSLGKVEFLLKFGADGTPTVHELVVVTGQVPVIVGCDSVCRYGGKLDFGANQLILLVVATREGPVIVGCDLVRRYGGKLDLGANQLTLRTPILDKMTKTDDSAAGSHTGHRAGAKCRLSV